MRGLRRRAQCSAIALGALLLAATGCSTTTLRSGLPPGDSPAQYTEKWHPAFLFGTIDAAGPYDLARICPQGWAEVTVEPDPFTAFAGAITLFIYSPSRVTIVCTVQRHASQPAPPGAR